MHEPLPIPTAVAIEFKGWDVSLAYSYGPATATWRLSRGESSQFLKLARQGWEPSLALERDRMRWAASRGVPVPIDIDYGVTDGTEWLLTESLPGIPATDEKLTADPASLVPLLAQGLRALHETPIHDCPFSFRLSDALIHVHHRVESGIVDPALDFHSEHVHLTPGRALKELEMRRPETEEVVLCHGDYCLPNVLVDDGRISGYVDLGELGLADRWWDLSVATWSVGWNLGPDWEPAFLDAYGIEPDLERVDYFRLLYDLAS